MILTKTDSRQLILYCMRLYIVVCISCFASVNFIIILYYTNFHYFFLSSRRELKSTFNASILLHHYNVALEIRCLFSFFSSKFDALVFQYTAIKFKLTIFFVNWNIYNLMYIALLYFIQEKWQWNGNTSRFLGYEVWVDR